MTVLDLLRNRPDEESLEVRQQAGRKGWMIDPNGWFKRRRGPYDPISVLLGFMTETEVFVVSCALAIQYDDLAWINYCVAVTDAAKQVQPPADCSQ